MINFCYDHRKIKKAKNISLLNYFAVNVVLNQQKEDHNRRYVKNIKLFPMFPFNPHDNKNKF